MLDQAGQADGDDEKQADREDHRHDDRPRPYPSGDLQIGVGELSVGRDPKRPHADPERFRQRHHPADHRPAVDATALGPRDERKRIDRDLAELGGGWLSRGLANRDRPGADAAHHHPFEDRLAPERRVTRGGQRLPPPRPDSRRIGLRARGSWPSARRAGPSPLAAGSAPPVHRCRRASAYRCRTDGTRSRSRRGSRALSSAS